MVAQFVGTIIDSEDTYIGGGVGETIAHLDLAGRRPILGRECRTVSRRDITLGWLSQRGPKQMSE